MVATTETTDYLYECMFLVDSSRFASDHEGVMATLTGMLEKAGGAVVVARPWQDGRLAYEMEGHRKGTHILFLLRMPGSGVKIVTRSVHLSDLVIRHLVIRHSEAMFEAMTNALSPEGEIQHSIYDEVGRKEPVNEAEEETDDDDDNDDSDE